MYVCIKTSSSNSRCLVSLIPECIYFLRYSAISSGKFSKLKVRFILKAKNFYAVIYI